MQWEAVAKLHKIEGEEKLFSLIACIKGKAADYMCDLPLYVKSDFDELVSEMELMFEIVKKEGKLPWWYMDKLDECYQGNLSVSEFAFRVSSWANKARFKQEKECPGPDFKGLGMDVWAGNAFLRGVNNQNQDYMIKMAA